MCPHLHGLISNVAGNSIPLAFFLYNFCSPTNSLTRSSRGLNCLWDIKDDRTTTFLHFPLSSAFGRASPNTNFVDSDILSSHLFFCLPYLPPPTVRCRIILASPVDLVMRPYHLNLRFLTLVIRSSYGPIACLIVFLTSSFVT